MLVARGVRSSATRIIRAADWEEEGEEGSARLTGKECKVPHRSAWRKATYGSSMFSRSGQQSERRRLRGRCEEDCERHCSQSTSPNRMLTEVQKSGPASSRLRSSSCPIECAASTTVHTPFSFAIFTSSFHGMRAPGFEMILSMMATRLLFGPAAWASGDERSLVNSATISAEVVGKLIGWTTTRG